MQLVGRTGTYGTSAEGYRAFHPRPLPPDPVIEFSDLLRTKLSKADQDLGRLVGSAQLLPDPDFFVRSYVRKEAVLSSQIEGTRSSLSDLLEYEAGGERAQRSKDAKIVSNHVRALNAAVRALRAGEKPTMDLLKKTHSILFRDAPEEDADPGNIRTKQNWIGGASPATADFVPPPPEELPTALDSLDQYLRSAAPVPPLVRAALSHAQFETIHPFLNGNGRIGRILVALVLLESGSMESPILYLSYYLLKHRDQYTRALQRTRDGGDLEGWLEFFFDAVSETAIQAALTAKAILRLREEERLLIQRELGRRSGRGQILLDYLFLHPVTDVNLVAAALRVSFPPANDLVGDFRRLGLLREITGQSRNRLFRFQPYIDTMQKDPASAVSAAQESPPPSPTN
jgi:Fic family protein